MESSSDEEEVFLNFDFKKKKKEEKKTFRNIFQNSETKERYHVLIQ